MSDEQKYYTPAKEDFRIGFKYEFKSPISGDWIPVTVEEEEYEQDNLDICKMIDLDIFELPLRVPYLTADQIESEGWVKQINPAYFVRERNGFKYQLTAFHDEAQAMETNCPRCHVIIRINPGPWVIDHFQVFRGTIRCINDLRSISKLLGIETTKNNAI